MPPRRARLCVESASRGFHTLVDYATLGPDEQRHVSRFSGEAPD
jgi:hypothetical protein